MLTLCPQCNSTFEGSKQCPRCGCQLQHFNGQPGAKATHPFFQMVVRLQQTLEGRIFVSVLLVLALSYGLLSLCRTSLQGLNAESGGVPLDPLAKLSLFLAMQALAVLTGAALSGVGQRRGFVFGAMVGALNGLLIVWGLLTGLFGLLFPAFTTEPLTPGTHSYPIALLALPALLTICGAVGGFLGSVIWKPAPDLTLVLFPGGKPGTPGWNPRRPEINSDPGAMEGPVALKKVVVGTVVAFLGGGWTDSLIDAILALSEGHMKITTDTDNLLAYVVVFSFSILTGGFIAGAGRFNWMKQGGCVGIGAALTLALLFWNGVAQHSVSVVYPIIATLCLGPIGAWFGSEIMPPVSKKARLGHGKRRW
jgi:hypothetical protein